ncbi:DNA helicase [Ralstonia solanacearum]|uniref:DEAD/DEAH box helicase n=1 Tax=Ralstonia solanacearum TaxID=305 RepID=UPI0005AC0C44|nr:DEAD/DEAH box helicase [Ralstonia solanacearum]MBB6592705.1 DNA helicase [Ralstonia solanacearum]MBB6596927.1 DNA helicase [Ralstonia solanacearum]MDB0541171.1 DNA helicase [Ralstonia solanacearum]MDB0551455.1 DNA helicase [Ralstonia solanacearum]MDB0556120.1 DNA helicase [Ralstonia solanacearum]
MGQEEDIVRYWHAAELLQPQAAPKLQKRDNDYASFFHDVTVGQLVTPWSADSLVAKQRLPKKRVWSHTLFAHLYDSRVVADKLKDLYGADQGYKEPQSRESALFAVKFTADGLMVDDSLVLSSEAWFLGRALAGKDWTRGFEADQMGLREQIKSLMGGKVSAAVLRGLTEYIRHFLGVEGFFGEMDERRLRFRSTPIQPDRRDKEDDPLNSFLLSDLADVADGLRRGVTSAPLDLYLRKHDPESRLHLDDDWASLPLIEQLMPSQYASSCWPAERHLGLVHSQQLAVNTIRATLAKGEGLLGVNGPPGTGKTTLLRDLIASIVTDRADVLAGLPRASDAFVANGRENANDGGNSQTCFQLKPTLFGFEIVVASSNNGAVENVTLELPQRDKIDESWLPDAEYFSEQGELVTGKPAWALISGALGSKTRRQAFVSRYFFGEKPKDTAAKSAARTAAENEDDETENVDDALIDEPETLDEGDGAAVAEEERRGMMQWLNAQADVARTPEQRRQIWQQAVAGYNAAKRQAEQIGATAAQMPEMLRTLIQTRRQAVEQATALKALEGRVEALGAELERLDADVWQPAQQELQACLQTLEQHLAAKPGFWANLLSLWGAGRAWEGNKQLLAGRHALAHAGFERVKREIDRLVAERQVQEKQIAATTNTLQQARERELRLHTQAITLAQTSQAQHLVEWLRTGAIGRGDDIELAEPWIVEGWRQARARVFIEALKLHRTFFSLEAKRLRSNLFFINSILTGGRFAGVSREAIRSAWASLFMVVPVLSSTFASFARSFGSLGAGEIGWLLVDEAGQASPQAAVGALWRSRRAVLVGDPLQLKPIVSVSDAVLEHMRARYGVDPHWLPNRQSAQTLADEATSWGKMLGPAGRKKWVGLPLVVHRRCDRPMYELANRIAYDGAMVYGTIAPRPDKETKASLPSGWLHTAGPSMGNWVPAEGDVLRQLLAALRADGVADDEISVITPFKAVRQRLGGYLPAKMVHGTIHTMQGKESAVVVLVLGGNANSDGARNWAVAEPNLLNVAATRAKRRFYVIGDMDDWKGRRLFCDVMDLLPPLQLRAAPLTDLLAQE